jgi:predicted restriction endonuclease
MTIESPSRSGTGPVRVRPAPPSCGPRTPPLRFRAAVVQGKERVLIERGRRCQLCGFTFKKVDGEEYAECHHLEPVSQGGPDHADNLLVVCPNHHKELHWAAVTFPGSKSRPETVCINGETITVRWGQ